MKTPRERLLERHRAQEPKLDQIRATVLAQHLGARPVDAPRINPPPATPTASTLGSWLAAWLRQLGSLRPHLAGWAALWIAVVIMKWVTPEAAISPVAQANTPLPEQRLALAERRRMVAELQDGTPKADVEPKFAPRPRTERTPDQTEA